MKTNAERFWAKTLLTPSGCVVWTGNKDNRHYGRFWLDGKRASAHRWAYTWANGPIPEGLVIDHLCRNHSCVSPAHLEAVTQRINVLRGISHQAVNATKTHCTSGHEYTPENTYTTPQGARNCRRCIAAATRRYRQRRAA